MNGMHTIALPVTRLTGRTEFVQRERRARAMDKQGDGTVRRLARLWVAALALPLFVAPAAAEESPFLPPKERQDNLESRLQQKIDRAVAGLEERLAKAMIDALDGKARDGALPKALEDALARRGVGMPPGGLSNGSLSNGGLPGGRQPAGNAPRLPPLPNLSAAELVPSGATFIGCLDGRAFFQDRAGAPFLIDPRAFPPTAGGPATCAR